MHEIQKTQAVRIVDMIVITPLLIGAALTNKKLPPLVRVALFITGGLTGIYNAQNYRRQQKQLEMMDL